MTAENASTVVVRAQPTPVCRSLAQHQAIVMRAAAGDDAVAASAVRENCTTLGATLDRASPATS